MAHVITKDELPHSGNARTFEGERHGGVDVSFFLIDAPPGGGPGLHIHPYAEVFVVHEGHVTYTVGEETIEATAEQIVIVPPGVPHKFVNSGTGPLRQIDIHDSGRIIQEWLEE